MIDDPWLILSYYLCTTPVLPPSLLAAIASIPVSLVSYLLVHWVPDFTVVVTFFFFWAKWSLRFWWRSGPWNWWYFFQTRPHVRSIIHQSEHEWAVVLQRSDYDSNPSFWNQSPEGSWVSSDLDCSSSSAAPTGLTRTRYLQNRSVYHTLVRTCL